MATIHLHGLGHFHPETVIDNAFLESLDIGTSEEWIVSRVGIVARRTVLPLDYIRQTKNVDVRAADEVALHSNADTGARAARMAIARAGLEPDAIGMVVAGGCSPQMCIPAEASTIACELGLDVPAFDLHSACSTFGLHLHVLGQMGEALPDYVLSVMPENNTRVVDYRDRSAAVLWGDAAAAAVISTRVPGRARVLHSSYGGAPGGAMDVVIPRTGHFSQNGPRVQKFAIKRMSALIDDCRDAVGEGAERLAFVGHQANLTMLQSVARRRGIPDERHWHNIRLFGNQGSAGAPAVLSQRWDDIVAGELVAVAVVGSGLSWSSLVLRF